MHQKEEITSSEIKQEFQLERMILFSDAVFAIVITLMAIEIHLPETVEGAEKHPLTHQLKHLLPVFISYTISFFFIGMTWYQHLKIFSLLKDYDKGLVIRNLMLLFFIALFPFCASVIIKAKGETIAYFMYLGAILACVTLQYVLHHYILIKRPNLRVNTNVGEHLLELKKRKQTLILFCVAIAAISITYYVVPNEEYKALASLWIMIIPIAVRRLNKSVKKPQKAQ